MNPVDLPSTLNKKTSNESSESSRTFRGGISRRRILSSLGAAAALPFCSDVTRAANPSSEEEKPVAQYTAFMALPTFTKLEGLTGEKYEKSKVNSMGTGLMAALKQSPSERPQLTEVKPVEPKSHYISDGVFDYGGEGWEDQFTDSPILIPYRREKFEADQADKDLYQATFQFLFGLKISGEPANAEKIAINLKPLGEDDNNGIVSITGAGEVFDVSEVKASKNNSIEVDSSNLYDGLDINVTFNKLFGTDDQMLRPFKLAFTVTVLDENGGVLRKDREALKFLSLGSNSTAEHLLTAVDKAWSKGLESLDVLGTTPVEKIYTAQKLGLALQTGSEGGELAREAVVEDISAFKTPISKRREIHDKKGAVRMAGTKMAGALKPTESPRPSETRSDAGDTPPNTPEGGDIYMDKEQKSHFLIKPIDKSSLKCLYRDTGEKAYDTSIFELDIETDEVNRTYALTEITNDPVFNPGDGYLINKETLGLESDLDILGGEFMLYYISKGERHPIVKTSINSD